MGATGQRRLVGLTVGDAPAAWRALGFVVAEDRFTVGGVTVHLVGDHAARGLLAWSLSPAVTGDVDGLAPGPGPVPSREVAHPNRVTGVDHVVVATPHLARTVAALATVGLEPRRVVEGLRGGSRAYAFFLLGTCVLEVIGPRDHDPGRAPAPAAFVGLAFVADDLAAVADLPDVAGEPHDAIQPGRRIVTLHTDAHGVSVPVALLTPRPAPDRRAEGP